MIYKNNNTEPVAMYSNGYKGESLEEAIHGKDDMETLQGQKIRVDEADEINSNLSSLIDEWANSALRKVDDHYEYNIDASYDDRFSGETVIKALRSANPRDYLIDELFDSFVDYEDTTKSELITDLEKFLKEKKVEYDFDELLELFDNKVSINLPYDDYFNAEYKCRIVVDTGDANYDFALNPCYNYDGEEIDSNASIVWLAKQQGYTEEDVKRALTTDDVNSLDGFLKSILDEVLNTTTSLNSLVFLCTATLNQLIDQNKNKLPITVSKNATCGLVDFWSGGGSVLGINLQKPVTIPCEYVYEFVPDVDTLKYSVDSIYRLTGGAYSATVTIGGGSSKITESVSAVKNILNGLVSKDGKSIRAFRSDEKLPRGFRFKSGTGDHGEVSYKGIDYAYALVDGKLRVMPSSDTGWNWSETIYDDDFYGRYGERK